MAIRAWRKQGWAFESALDEDDGELCLEGLGNFLLSVTGAIGFGEWILAAWLIK